MSRPRSRSGGQRRIIGEELDWVDREMIALEARESLLEQSLRKEQVHFNALKQRNRQVDALLRREEGVCRTQQRDLAVLKEECDRLQEALGSITASKRALEETFREEHVLLEEKRLFAA